MPDALAMPSTKRSIGSAPRNTLRYLQHMNRAKRIMHNETWNFRLLRTGSFRLDGGAMFGIIPRVLWSKMTEPDDQNRILLQTNCLLLENGAGRRVIVETGYGNKFDGKNRDIFALEDRCIVDALGEINVDPAEIDDAIVTHLHFDHAGGLTSRHHSSNEVHLTFPNARIHVQRREWEDARFNRSTMSKTYLPENLEAISNRVECHDGQVEPLPGIELIPAPGHTWGQQAVLFRDAASDQLVVFPGDVMPTANHFGMPFNMAYDVEPFTNMSTKRYLMDRAVDEGWRWIIDHEPGNPVVRVERADANEKRAFKLVSI